MGPVLLTNSAEITIQPNQNKVFVLCLSDSGIKAKEGTFTENPDTDNKEFLVELFNNNHIEMVVKSLTIKAKTKAITRGCYVAREGISITAETLNISPTILGTDGTVTLIFSNPNSLIKSLILQSSMVRASLLGEQLSIGYIQGDFTGIPSSTEQILTLFGYPSITIEFNPEAIAELLSKK